MNIYDIWYSTIKMSNKLKLYILKKLRTTEEIYTYCNSDWKVFNGEIDENILKIKLLKSWDILKIKTLVDFAENNHIEVIDYFHQLYPSKLKNLEDAPSILYYKGNISKLNTPSVSIVGTRKASYYGRKATDIICRELSKKEINIISGMAMGIDAFAHWGALKNNTYTCAILGSGIDVIYPKVNRDLYYKILENGCIISEYPPGTEPYAYNFPLRNRIISGLGDVLIVIEASEKSGTLITANCALDQGKDVLAVPGSIFCETSKGTNKLIKDGAYPLTSIEDIFHLINMDYNTKRENESTALNIVEKRIYNILCSDPIHIDDLYKITNIDIKELYEVLFELQLKNQITCLSGNYYVRIANSI
ncbi:DNA-processing protein DprA [uncultured Clostridium sp.]|uniref:DNA-processing protein DprA n=1 Tax=uncultured Clostridium sp. TaxID=59620 RepID=UPI0028E8326F|nr:DNA-processing protein DprA [uncultured Clostridium sp.]